MVNRLLEAIKQSYPNLGVQENAEGKISESECNKGNPFHENLRPDLRDWSNKAQGI
jgi:hypothetical protein